MDQAAKIPNARVWSPKGAREVHQISIPEREVTPLIEACTKAGHFPASLAVLQSRQTINASAKSYEDSECKKREQWVDREEIRPSQREVRGSVRENDACSSDRC